MDNKTWLWRKRSAAKTLEADKSNEILSHEEEKSEGPTLEKKELESDLKLLNEKLSSALAECEAKDNIVTKQLKIAEDAIAGWEKAEKDALSLKQELDEVSKQKSASEEKLVNMDAALRECMQELRRVRENQHKMSEDHHMSTVASGKKSAEAFRKILELEAENAQLAKALSVKDKVVEDLSECRTQIEADISPLILRLDATKKENDSLNYKVRVLQRDLQMRNEEIEHFRNEKKLATACNRNMMQASEMNLMDDFAEMEKLAGVSVNNQAGSENFLQMPVNKGADTNKSDDKVHSDVNVYIGKILELLEDHKLLPYRIPLTPTGDTVRMFQWRPAELSTVLHRFVQICHGLKNGTANLEEFVQQVAYDLEWVVNHCSSLGEVSSTKESFVNQLYWEEFKTWNNELAEKDCSGVDFEAMLRSEIASVECLRAQLQESKRTIEKLQSEIESMKESRGRARLNDSNSKNPVNSKIKSFQNLQERSRMDEEIRDPKHVNHFQSDWEITAASEKLANCQETILDLGKQLKSLAPPNDAAVFDEILSKSAFSEGKSTSRKRSSLLDKMLAEDSDRLAASFGTAISESTKGISSYAVSNSTTTTGSSLGKLTISDGKTAAAYMDIVTRKKEDDDDKSFFKRLFRRRRKSKYGKIVS